MAVLLGRLSWAVLRRKHRVYDCMVGGPNDCMPDQPFVAVTPRDALRACAPANQAAVCNVRVASKQMPLASSGCATRYLAARGCWYREW